MITKAKQVFSEVAEQNRVAVIETQRPILHAITPGLSSKPSIINAIAVSQTKRNTGRLAYAPSSCDQTKP
jgi:hypothetical protein